jgi:hypothetical protein
MLEDSPNFCILADPSGKKKDVQVRECNMIPMTVSPLYDIDTRKYMHGETLALLNSKH